MPDLFRLRPAETYVLHLEVGDDEVFEGPLDLLLHLIERQELPITSVSLAQVTSQYLEYIAQLEVRHPEGIAEFLVMAARLLYIKSAALLPRHEPAGDEEEEEDPAEALARQLREYKLYKERAEHLQALEASGRRGYLRLAPPPKLEKRLEPGGMKIDALVAAVYDALRDLEAPPRPVSGIEPHKITVEDKMAALREHLLAEKVVRFRQFLGQATTRVEIVVSLLAVLEMLKRRQVIVQQPVPFGEILIEVLSQPLPASPSDQEQE